MRKSFYNGVLQHVDLVSSEAMPLNIVLTLDSSSSLRGPRLVHLRSAGYALLQALKTDDEAGLITFSHVVRERSALASRHEQLRAALDVVEAKGATALIDGTYAGMVLAESGSGRPLLIVFSDGRDTTSWLTADFVLDAARRSEVVVYAVAVGNQHSGFLHDLTAASGGAIVEADSTDRVGAAFLRILDEFRMRYLVSYSPHGVARDGWHMLDVRIRGRKAAVKARRIRGGFVTPRC
jgi:Ca-activated chloride channel homolog